MGKMNGKNGKKKPEREEMLTLDESVSILKTSRATFNRWLDEGRVKGFKAGKQWRFYRKDLDNFLKRETEESRISPKDLETAVERFRARLKKAGYTDKEVLDIENKVQETPDLAINKLVDFILLEAVKKGASDIHLEPGLEGLRLRYRTDGVLQETEAPPFIFYSKIVFRVKVMCKMDVDEQDIPQAGRVKINIGKDEFVFFVSTFPTHFGERLVMRIFDLSRGLDMVKLDRLGYSKEVLANIRKLIKRPSGLVLVTGPTGCGRTITLYACLKELDSRKLNIMTIEDPVEVDLEGISQAFINPPKDLFFANALKGILRQDPDVIMVGEIRDLETAMMVQRATLTGHLIFSTLHTEDAPGAITRLLDMGTEPFLVNSSLSGILAQRLVRKICPKCKEVYKPGVKTLKKLGVLKDGKFYKGKGCKECGNTGYKGRTPITEFLIMNDSIRNLIAGKASTNDLKKAAIKTGMKTMKDDGIEKALKGITTIDEVSRIIPQD